MSVSVTCRNGARAGAGSTHAFENEFRGRVDQGGLDPVLEAYDDPSPGFFLYFPARRHMAPKLRALVETYGQVSEERC